MKPTPEQEAIVASISTHSNPLMINALAGTGKTSTLKLVEQEILRQHPATPILYLVFNTANAKAAIFDPNVEDEERAKRMSLTTDVKTLNGLGYGIWRNTITPRCNVNAKKTNEILTALIKEMKKGSRRDEASNVYTEVTAGVEMAKSLGYVPPDIENGAKPLATWDSVVERLDTPPSDFTTYLIDEVLAISIKQAYSGLLDFNDQIYMPALFGGAYPVYPNIMVDEFQDLNPCNHAMLDQLFARARGIGVGDPWQSIYAFRGARQGGMREAVGKYSMTELNLSVSFRCPRAIVEAARWRVPHFNWLKDGGHVEVLDHLLWDSVPDDAVFICRNNAPLFRLAMRSLIAGRGVNIAGSDVGPRIIGIMRKLGHESISRAQLTEAINTWEQDKLYKGSKVAPDMAACMRVFANVGANLRQALAYAEHLFSSSGTIRMMTGHKAKGLEFDHVYFLDSYLCREDEQDQNLRYVIQTRAKDRLSYIDSERVIFDASN